MPQLKVKNAFLKPKATRVTAEDRDRVIAQVNDLASNWKQRLRPWKKPSNQQKFTLISDCAGYGSDLIALRLLGLHKRVRCIMMSECNSGKVALHQAVAKTCGFDTSKTIHVSDMAQRDDSSAPEAHLYVAGYPCPSFSKLGKQKGAQDSRGMITIHGLKFIAKTRPMVIVLEQVSSLQHRKHKKVWDFILKVLGLLEYSVAYKVLNTRHYGVPHSRPRVYVLAVAAECLKGQKLEMPQPREQKPDLHTFLDKDTVGSEILSLPEYEKKLGPKMFTKGYVLDVCSSPRYQHALTNCCPCLTFTRCKEFGYYIPKLRRRLNSHECARLQGVPSAVLAAMLACCEKEGLPAGTVEASLGDAMSLNVLMLVLRAGLDAAGLSSIGKHKDYWLLCPSERCHALSDNLFAKHQS
eukprot:s89_g13.t1